MFFEWPSQGVFSFMDTTVTLKSIDFKVNRVADSISSVRCNYSNNKSSPVFENSNQSHSHPETVVFENVKAVTKVVAGSNDRANPLWKANA